MNECFNCKELTQNPKFCSQSCSAKHNNKLRRRPAKTCPSCAGEFYVQESNYCSMVCSKDHRMKIAVENWKNGDWSLVTRSGDSHGGELTRPFIMWLKEQANFACEWCGWREFHPVDGRPGVQVDHVDGNNKNQDPDNLRVLCLNCHWSTETYCARNISYKG